MIDLANRSRTVAELARKRGATPGELRAQRTSFAYGNVKIENDQATREAATLAAARVHKKNT